MIVSTQNRSDSRWLKASVVAMATLFVPCGAAYPDDHGAVAKRLKEAVKAGELNAKHAEVMLRTLKAIAAEDGGSKGKKSSEYDAAARKLEAAVKAGKLTRHEAKARWAAIHKAHGKVDAVKTHKKADAKKAHEKAIAKKAQKKVDSKKVDSKKVDSKKVDSKKVDSKKVDSKKVDSKKVDSKKVDSKKVHEKAVAKKKVAASRKRIDFGAVAKKLDSAVKAGKLTQDEAKAKWAALHKARGKVDAVKTHEKAIAKKRAAEGKKERIKALEGEKRVVSRKAIGRVAKVEARPDGDRHVTQRVRRLEAQVSELRAAIKELTAALRREAKPE